MTNENRIKHNGTITGIKFVSYKNKKWIYLIEENHSLGGSRMNDIFCET